jgi:sulfoxide reductase catalytic subunit YedY
MVKIHSSEITPESIYLSRRKFMLGLGAAAAGTVLSACGVGKAPRPANSTVLTPSQPAPTEAMSGADELGDGWTPYKQITAFNNYYEFSTSKTAVARLAENFKTDPWTVRVEGLVSVPTTFDLDDLRRFTQEERVYRMRCVETWSMVIPWQGFPLSSLLKAVEPTSKARYVRFETLYDPDQMPGQKDNQGYDWPYVEGLRLDEAMHDLTLMATGLYGQPLLPQSGAPLRLVVPWKYGFKSIKSVVKIELVEDMPVSLWMAAAPREYGFYANVNPEVPHPRWSQAREQRIGEDKLRQTLPFNGYAGEVASLYEGMDLAKFY